LLGASRKCKLCQKRAWVAPGPQGAPRSPEPEAEEKRQSPCRPELQRDYFSKVFHLSQKRWTIRGSYLTSVTYLAEPGLKSYQLSSWVFLCLVPLGEALARSYQLSLWTFVQLVPLGEPHLQCYQLSLRVFLWLGSNSVRGEG
jgi:hypothetical protein